MVAMKIFSASKASHSNTNKDKKVFHREQARKDKKKGMERERERQIQRLQPSLSRGVGKVLQG